MQPTDTESQGGSSGDHPAAAVHRSAGLLCGPTIPSEQVANDSLALCSICQEEKKEVKKKSNLLAN